MDRHLKPHDCLTAACSRRRLRFCETYPTRGGTPYKELHSPLAYGLLAHSHSWKGQNSSPEENVEQALLQADASQVTHPRLQLDLLCVADLASWTSSTMAFLGPRQVPDWSTMEAIYGPNGSAASAYIGHTRAQERQVEHFTPIAVLISYLSQKLAWEDPSFRDLADYYRMVNIAGSGMGALRTWPSSMYGDEVRPRVESGGLSNGKPLDEWSVGFQ
jgi:hypothetical protein